MNLKFGDFAIDFREAKENHSETRRASALFVGQLRFTYNAH